MNPSVPLLDLKAQYATIRHEVDGAIARVVASQRFILGEEVEALEAEVADYCGVRYAIACGSGTDAILLALMALGIGPGDEVICPAYTFFSTAGCIARLNARPVFADIDPMTYNVDASSIRAAAKRCTRLAAIMPVDLYGRSADMETILSLAEELAVPVIDDAAQALGSRDVQGCFAGSRGSLGTFSFYPSKNLGAYGDGGMVTTNDDELAKRVALLRIHGESSTYHHVMVGLNSRLDALQAAVLRVKLRHLERWHEARRSNARFYDEAFAAAAARPVAEHGFPVSTPDRAEPPARHIYNQYVIRVPSHLRDALQSHLRQNGVGTAIYYPLPLHLQPCFESLGYARGSLPRAEAAAAETLALPIYPELTTTQRQHVVETVVAFVDQQSLAHEPA